MLSITSVSATDNSTDTASDYITSTSTSSQITSANTSQDNAISHLITKQKKSASDTKDSTDYHTFDELITTISESTDEVTLEHDYKYADGSIIINKEKAFSINSDNHVIDGVTNVRRFFNIRSNDVVIISNLTFQNIVNSSMSFKSPAIFENISFINCSSMKEDIFIYAESYVEFYGCTFKDNDFIYKFIVDYDKDVVFKNCVISRGHYAYGAILIDRNTLTVENCIFENITSTLGSAINYKGRNLTVKNTTFYNLNASTSGGAIIAKFFQKNGSAGEPFLIENCEFVNVTSKNNGGAVYYDLDSGSKFLLTSLNIINTNFTNSKSRYGGAIANLGGILNIANCRFENNYADFEGGAIYTSWSDVNIANTTLTSNRAGKNAIYFDKKTLSISKSNITDTEVADESNSKAKTIYAYDAGIDFCDTVFDNGGISVYADFLTNSRLANVTKNEDKFSLDNKNYITSIESTEIKLNLTNKTTTVDEIPSKYDLRDYEWVSPEKIQGDNDDCWAFATVASMESALLKSTSKFYNLSQNYVQKLQLKYTPNGDLRISSTGFTYSGLGYALSWVGTLPVDDSYDERGMIADTILTDSRIHLQDALIIFGDDVNRNNLIKEAILKYGAVSVQLILVDCDEDIPTTGENISIFDHNIHFISLIGWDDSAGTWTYKDSLGGFEQIKYSSRMLLATDEYAIIPQNAAIAYIFENDVDYHVNYQTDLISLTGFDGNYTYYSNEFTSKYEELIGAVGTYFNESGIEYSFDIYVNGKKVHTQTGISEFAGFRTIKLNEYIPVNEGDSFKVVFRNNALPYQAYSKQHYLSRMSLASSDGQTWNDLSTQNKTVCLKVYTIEKKSSMINVTTIDEMINNTLVSITVSDEVTGDVITDAPVTITLENGDIISTDTGSTGILKQNLTLPAGINTITVKYTGSDTYHSINTTHSLDVRKLPSKITLTPMTAQVGDTITLTAHVTDVEDNPLTGGKLIFKLNGATIKDDEEKVIYARTNNGTATITYNIPLNYKAKTYNLTAVYEGNCAHNGYRSSPVELNLTKRQAQFTVTTNSTIKANETATIKVTVKEKEDTTPINGQYFIKINGKTVKDENDHDLLIPITNNTGEYNFTFGED